MRRFLHRYKPDDLTSGLDGKLIIQNEILLDNVAELKEAISTSVCFYENTKFLQELAILNAGLVVVPLDFDINLLPETNLFFCKKPYLTLNLIVAKWLEHEKEVKESSVHPTAIIADSVKLGSGVVIGEYVVIGKGTQIENRSIILANTVIGEDVMIGQDCHIYPNVTIYDRTELRDRVILHAGCVVGMDGFGYLQNEGRHEKVHHIGKLIIEDDVEIGANTCIDRATFGTSLIGKGSKIDNLVQIGHNCRLGKNVILCSQVGLAGNTVIGDNVYLGGQVGSAGHLKINDGAMIGAQSGVRGDVPPGARFLGTPAINASLQKRIIVALKRLPEILTFFNKAKKDKQAGEE
jgi:UDP-3-O-[3-hydroxymyristoyl] glucosamine N-acyltransferase